MISYGYLWLAFNLLKLRIYKKLKNRVFVKFIIKKLGSWFTRTMPSSRYFTWRRPSAMMRNGIGKSRKEAEKRSTKFLIEKLAAEAHLHMGTLSKFLEDHTSVPRVDVEEALYELTIIHGDGLTAKEKRLCASLTARTKRALR